MSDLRAVSRALWGRAGSLAALGLGLGAAAVAAAADAPVVLPPAPALELGPCELRADAPCWAEARTLARFHPAPGVHQDPVQAEVRLAWEAGGALLVQVAALPEGVLVELVLDREGGDALRRGVLAELGEGTHRVSGGPALAPGTRVALRVGVRREQAGEVAVLPWTPSGPADVARPFPGLAVARPGAHAQALRVDPTGVDASSPRVLDAPGAHLELTAWEGGTGRRHRGVPPAWTLAGPAPLEMPPPPWTGWARVEATWVDEAGVAVGLAAGWLALRAPTAPELLSPEGFHPAPRVLQRTGGAAFRLRPGAAVVLEEPSHAAAAELLAEELGRLTGLRPEVRTGSSARGDVRVGAELSGLSPELRELASRPGAFALEVDAAGARVLAPDLRGALAGSLALADGLGLDGRLLALRAADAPALPRRFLHHNLTLSGPFDGEAYRRFLRRVVARGRYDTLVLGIFEAFPFSGAHGLDPRGRLQPEELQALLRDARELGLEVVPGGLGRVRGGELARAYPALAEEPGGRMLCTRHPETFPLLEGLYDEVLAAFGEGGLVHIAHDEVVWRSERLPAEDRCPRCAGTPRWRLFADSLAWHLDHARRRGRRAVAWADVLTEGWNGEREGGDRALELLDPEALGALLLASWARVGDPEASLAPVGVPLWRGSTGYDDHKRRGLAEVQDLVEAEGLGLFVPHPWTSTGRSGDAPALRYHLGSVLLAGTTGWRPELARDPVDVDLLALVRADQPGVLPGYVALPAGRLEHLDLEGAPWPASVPEVAWPERLEVAALDLGRPRPVVLDAALDEALDLGVSGRVQALSLLQATWLSRSAEQELSARAGSDGLAPVAWLEVALADGRILREPLHPGTDTGPLAGSRRHLVQRDTAGVLPLSSALAAAQDPGFADLRLYRWDWRHPEPEVPVRAVTLRPTTPGGLLLLGAAAAVR